VPVTRNPDDGPTNATLALVERFHDAFNRQDIEAVMALMADDCVFENTYPPPDGTRHAGRQAVRAAFSDFFASSPGAHFEIEDVAALGGHAVLRWRYQWNNPDSQGHIRGVDVFRIQDGKIAAKLSYVKG
jgi:uncharacterized protein (TIGR02246 family)